MDKFIKKTGSRRNYSEQQLILALQAIKDGSSQCAASKKYGIPKSTLFYKVTGKHELGKKLGPATVLSAEEENIVEKWILNLGKRGFPVRKRQLLRSIQLYLNTNQKKTLFVNNHPGKIWYQNFLNRHPVISEKKLQNLTSHKTAVTKDHIKRWHADVYNYCEANNLIEALNDPNRIFNMDERGFILKLKNEVVLTKGGDRALYKRSQNNEKECVTALLGGNASGLFTPPMIVYPYKQMPPPIQLNVPAKWSAGISDNGCQTLDTFYNYITNVFHKWLLEQKIKLPVILFIDSHRSHISLTLSDFCAAHQIELLALNPNSSHLIQPMEVGVLKSLNTSFVKKLEDWKLTHNYEKIQKTDIASILNDAIIAIDYASCVKKGFEKSGLFPFIVDSIDLSRVPSTEVAAASHDKLLDLTTNFGSNAVQLSLENKNQEEALHRLNHFEAMIDDVILHLFKFSNDNWSGPKEYEALFEIWKKLHMEASDSSTMTPDIDSLTSQVQISTSTKEIGQSSMLSNSNSEWNVNDAQSLDSKAIGSMIFEYEDTESCEPIELGTDEQCIVIEIPHTQDISVDMLTEESSLNVPGSKSFNVPEKESPNDLSTSKENYDPKLKTSNDKRFDVDAFKQSFFWPTANIKKNKRKTLHEIRSTVITSLDWRCKERKKVECKLQAEAEKQSRKAARTTKKIEAAALKVEKKIAKEIKKKDQKQSKSLLLRV